MPDTLRILVVGAHPDDPDLAAGGCAALWADRGHRVRFVSLANGDAGHQTMRGEALAARRAGEAAAAGRVLGCEYTVMGNHDGWLEPDHENRRAVLALLRSYVPDLVIAPRPWDYHPDHRAAAMLVQDAVYMATVPSAVPEPHLRRMPVVVLAFDRFQRPCPFSPDVVVDIGSVVHRKVRALDAHASQVYEWLPYNREEEASVPPASDPAARLEWLEGVLLPRFRRPAALYKEALQARYGAERGGAVEFAEAFEVSEYGRQPSPEDLARLFPF